MSTPSGSDPYSDSYNPAPSYGDQSYTPQYPGTGTSASAGDTSGTYGSTGNYGGGDYSSGNYGSAYSASSTPSTTDPYAAPGAYSPQTYQQGYAPAAPRTNTLAILALVFSLMGIGTWFTAIGGIVCGHIARKQIRQTGEGGAGMATAGLVIGYIVAIGGILFLLAYVGFIIVMIIIGASASTY